MLPDVEESWDKVCGTGVGRGVASDEKELRGWSISWASSVAGQESVVVSAGVDGLLSLRGGSTLLSRGPGPRG